MRCKVAFISANTLTDSPTAAAAIGTSSGLANSRQQLPTAYQKHARGTESQMAPAPTGKQMTVQEPTFKRPDFRCECNQPKVYRCLRAFMGAFSQQDCYAFMLDEDGADRCNFQELNGCCNRGSGIE